MKSIALLLLLFGHGLTQVGISIPDLTWRPWMLMHFTQGIEASIIFLFVVRLIVDFGICLWILGPERRELAWHAVTQRSHRAQDLA